MSWILLLGSQVAQPPTEPPPPVVAADFVGDVKVHRWYVRRGKKLHIFDRADQADAFIDAQQQAADAVALAQKTSRRARQRVRARIELPEPDQTIDVDQLARWVAELQIGANLPALIAQQDYAQVAQLQAIAQALQDEQDEEEAELLLLLA